MEELLAAIQGSIKKVKLTTQYRVGLLLAAVLMILLPLIYLGLIVLVSYGVYYHATANFDPIFNSGRSGSSARGGILLYVTPIVIGTLMVLFMIKPIFARPAKGEQLRSLDRSKEPKLFDFIEALCNSVHAPVPARIDVNCDVNASASFRRGILSMAGNDLVLTIGMPLVAGLNARELAGVLAHEFGHFSQGFGMRLSYIVRSINFWFVRVVYQRDKWDELLESWAKGIDIRLSLILNIARGGIWLNRKLLWCLMMLGHIVCSYLMRQMEFDADLHECRFSGSDTFESTAKKLPELSLALNEAMSDQHGFFLDGKLCNNLPELMLVNYAEHTEEMKQALQKHAETEKTEWMATHPSTADRVNAARREDAPGIFRLTHPASSLFTHYEETCLGVTNDLLKEQLGEDFNESMLVDIGKVKSEKSSMADGFKATKEVFGTPFKVVRPIPIQAKDLQTAVRANDMLNQLKSSRQAMSQGRQTYIKQTEDLDNLDTQWVEVNQAITLLELGAKLNPKNFAFPVKSEAEARNFDAELRDKLFASSNEMLSYEKLFIQRAVAAVRLLEAPQVAQRIDNSVVLKESCKAAFSTLEVLQSHLRPFFVARNSYISMTPILSSLSEGNVPQAVVDKILALTQDMNVSMQQLEEDLNEVHFPYDHPDGKITIAKYLVPNRPAPDDIGTIITTGQKLIEQFQFLYVRCIGTLSSTILAVEKGIGLPSVDTPIANQETSQQT